MSDIDNSQNKTVFVVGQAMPKPPYPPRPFGRTKLYSWFAQARIPESYIKANFHFGALVSFYPGSRNGNHIVPDHATITRERPQLIRKLNKINPDIILPVGKLAITYALSTSPDCRSLTDCVGRSFVQRPFGWGDSDKLIIPLPHPSGASTWFYTDTNKQLLEQALQILRASLNIH